jgi:hypothetical protein
MRDLCGSSNPNWKGGLVAKTCLACSSDFQVKPARADAKFCSMQCVGVSQRGRVLPARSRTTKRCAICSVEFTRPTAHATRIECCSRRCGGILRARRQGGPGNPNWRGGLSRLPYPWNFRSISRAVIERDGSCLNPECPGHDPRLTAHHIDYDKQNCAWDNLITLCSACNSKANFDRPKWQRFYAALAKKHGGGWAREEF